MTSCLALYAEYESTLKLAFTELVDVIPCRARKWAAPWCGAALSTCLSSCALFTAPIEVRAACEVAFFAAAEVVRVVAGTSVITISTMSSMVRPDITWARVCLRV